MVCCYVSMAKMTDGGQDITFACLENRLVPKQALLLVSDHSSESASLPGEEEEITVCNHILSNAFSSITENTHLPLMY